MKHVEHLQQLGACREGIEWAATQPDIASVWANCRRADWMLWLAAKCHVDRRILVTVACEIARDVLPIFEAKHPTENRPRVAIETAEAWVRGEATVAQVSAAAAAAYAAADAAADAYAAYAAYAAAYAATAYAARTQALARYADIVRHHIPATMIEAKMIGGGE